MNALSVKTHLDTVVSEGETFPVFLTPITKISVAAVKNALRNHYQGTSHDPYASHNPQEPWRPISVFRTQESHILQVRPKLPQAIGNVEYIAYGMPSLSVYLPYYQGMHHYQPGDDKGTDRASNDSTYWTFRTLQTLVMQDYNAFAPDVQHAWKTFEQQTAKQQYKMEQSYLRLYASHPKEAQRLLQNFEDKTMQNAQTLARRLTNNIITTMTYRTDMKYHFSSTQP